MSEQINLTGPLDHEFHQSSPVIDGDSLGCSALNQPICDFISSNEVCVKICFVGPPKAGKTKIIGNYVSTKRDRIFNTTSDIERIKFFYKGQDNL
jgi:hypothetical protein